VCFLPIECFRGTQNQHTKQQKLIDLYNYNGDIMQSLKLVTIYIPTHNRPSLVKRAIQSVLNQTYNRIELIVCDDGSDWDSYEEVRTLIKNVGGHYIRIDSASGACAARNKAIKAATGEYITGLDDDDEMLPEHVENLVENYNPDFSFVCAGYLTVNNGRYKPQRFQYGRIDLHKLLHSNCVGNQVLTETKKMLEIDGFDENMPAMQDYDAWIRLLQRFGEALKLRKYTYLQHTDHEQGRISLDKKKLSSAFDMLRYKNKMFYKKSHLNTHQLIEVKHSGDKLTTAKLVQTINRYNYRLALALYLKR